MKWKYTYKDLMDMIEMLDAHDTLEREAELRRKTSKPGSK